jgi:hypothetical protein
MRSPTSWSVSGSRSGTSWPSRSKPARRSGRGLLDRQGVLQAVRAGLHRRRRARPDPGAHRLPRTAEDVYLYRTRMPPETARKFFMEYIREINSLKQHPNGTTRSPRTAPRRGAAHPRLRRQGSTTTGRCCSPATRPSMPTKTGGLDTRIPFEELRKLSYINPRARALGDDPEFSRKIREGLPAPGR